jgi:hypothetical protein
LENNQMSQGLECREHFHFGEGKVTVQIASIGDVPALIFTHAVIGGVPGEIAPKEEPSVEDPNVLRESVILTFKSEALRDAVEAALMGQLK